MARRHQSRGYAGYFGGEHFGGANFIKACGQFTATDIHQGWVDLVIDKASYLQNAAAQVASVTVNAIFE